MNLPQIVATVLEDLALVATSEPNERLPKEEQIRCCIYAAIRPLFRVVCAERGYGSIDERNRIECDLWASSPGQKPVWIEFKRCWFAKGWVNKPPEQLRYWQSDLDKLRNVPVASERYFMLVGFFDFDPLNTDLSAHSGVVQNIQRFHLKQIVHCASREFAWRTNDGIKWMGVWVWHWATGCRVKV